MLPSVKHIHRPLYPLSRFGDSVACVSLFTISTAFFKNYSRPADTSGTRFCFEPPQPPYRCTRSERKYVRCYISHFTCSPELGPGVSCVPLFTIPLGPSCCPFEFDRDVCGRSYFFVGPPALSSVAVGTGRAGVNFVAPISSRFTPVFGSRLQRSCLRAPSALVEIVGLSLNRPRARAHSASLALTSRFRLFHAFCRDRTNT